MEKELAYFYIKTIKLVRNYKKNVAWNVYTKEGALVEIQNFIEEIEKLIKEVEEQC